MDSWSGWTSELTKTASDMWTAGKSATQIGMVLGCNRNIVMGKMHRMGIASGSGLNLHNVRPSKPKPSKTPVRSIGAETARFEANIEPKAPDMLVRTTAPKSAPIQSSDGRADGRALKGPTGDLCEESQVTGAQAERGTRNSPVKCRPSEDAGGVNPHSLTATLTEDLGRLVREPVLKPGPSETTWLKPVAFAELQPCHCRWIRSQPSGAQTLYCGEIKSPRSPYCEEHRVAARGPGTPSERAAFKRPRVSAFSESFI